MKCACSGLWTTIGAVVGLVAIGYGGYNVLTTGCPLGTCRDSGGAAVVQAATTEKAGDACHGAGEGCSKGEVCTQSGECTKSEACTKDGEAAKCPFEHAGEAATCPHPAGAGTQAKAPTKG
ncbi:MAG: hypothetical protein DYG92_07990 [Leptolyngbya sp. PLA1]|nr:hypothetical protein [Leptolyngbya sp. PLA1]